MKVSREGIVLIKSLEGLRTGAAPRPDGGWVIGYGHTRSAREGAEVTEAEAELLLQYDLLGIVAAIHDHVRAPLNQHQFDALASFAFSVGADRFAGSDVVQALNAGGDIEAVEAMMLWPVRENGAPTGARRRAAERALFTADPTRAVTLADLFAAPLPPPAPLAPPAPANDVDPPAANVPELTAESPASNPRAVPADRSDARAQAVAMLLGESEEPAPFPDPSAPQANAAAMMSMMRYAAYGAPIVGPLPGAATPAPTQVSPPLNLTVPPPAPSPQPDPVPEPEPLPFPATVAQPEATPLELTSPPEIDTPIIRPVWAEQDRRPFEAPGEPLFADPLPYDTVLRHETVPHEPTPARTGWGETGAFAVMGGVGLVSFVAAMAAFRLAAEQDSVLGETGVIGGVLALIGLICIAVSALNLYHRWNQSRPR